MQFLIALRCSRVIGGYIHRHGMRPTERRDPLLNIRKIFGIAGMSNWHREQSRTLRTTSRTRALDVPRDDITISTRRCPVRARAYSQTSPTAGASPAEHGPSRHQLLITVKAMLAPATRRVPMQAWAKVGRVSPRMGLTRSRRCFSTWAGTTRARRAAIARHPIAV